MGARSKKAEKVRKAVEFDVRALQQALAVPSGSGMPLTSWTLSDILNARDMQLRGQFSLPAKMAEVMRTDDALFVARENRLAPLRCIKAELVPAGESPKAKQIAGEAESLFGQNGVGATSDSVSSIGSCLVDHDIAFAQTIPRVRDDGSRTDLQVVSWPIEHVRWDLRDRCFKTRIDHATPVPPELAGLGSEIPIVHGDGRWLIFQRYEIDPFKHAALLSAAVIWARHAYAARDWAKSSVAHGLVKALGTLPEGVPLKGAGMNTDEANAMIELMKGFISSDAPAGLKPFGSEVEFINNGSTAWEIFAKLIENAEKAAARIYLGTDGVLGAAGGAPGVDIQALFGVAATKVESDLACISRGLQTAIDIWCAINFGDSKLSPTRRYLVPDADADATRESTSKRRTAFFADVKAARENGFDVTQEFVNGLAKSYGIKPPTLKLAAPAADPAANDTAPASGTNLLEPVAASRAAKQDGQVRGRRRDAVG